MDKKRSHPSGSSESSIRLLDEHLGKKIHLIAFGASYLGTLKKIDYDKGYLVLTDEKDTVTIDLERIESFEPISS